MSIWKQVGFYKNYSTLNQFLYYFLGFVLDHNSVWLKFVFFIQEISTFVTHFSLMQKKTSKTTSWEQYKTKVSIAMIISFDGLLQSYFETCNLNFGKRLVKALRLDLKSPVLIPLGTQPGLETQPHNSRSWWPSGIKLINSSS